MMEPVDRRRPPRLAGWLLQRARPSDAEPILGDLEEDYRGRVLPVRGRGAADRWYWTMVLQSVVAHWRRPRARRGDARLERGRGGMVPNGIGRDLRLALRTLWRAPAYSAVVVVTLALGIGANAAVIGLVDAVLLRPLPYPAAERLAFIGQEDDEGRWRWASWLNFVDLQAGARGFESMTAMTWPTESTVLGGTEAARVPSIAVSADFWEIFGAVPVLGRLPTPEEHSLGARPVAVVSTGFWERVLASPTDLSGVSLRVGTETVDVVGVLPASFSVLEERVELWSPIERYAPAFTARGAHYLRIAGRLREGTTLAAAETELDAVASRLGQQYAGEMNLAGTQLRPLQEHVVGAARKPLLLLLGAAGLVLLIACTNVAGVALARGVVREREFAVRSSLGAGRGRLVRQLLIEGGVLTIAGAALGFALWGAGASMLRSGDLLAVPRGGEVALDGGVAAFTVLIALAVSLSIGLIPALRVSGADAAQALRAGGRGNADSRSSLWRALVAVQVGLALLLLVGAGLLMRSLGNVFAVETGWNAENVIAASISLPAARYPDDATASRFMQQTLEEIRRIPGVEHAGLSSKTPLEAWDYTGPFGLDTGESTERYIAGYRVADADYFPALGIPLLSGRLFDERIDGPAAAHAVVINETLARRFWPDGDAVGRRIRAPGMDRYQGEWMTIVGVVGEARHWRNSPGNQGEYYVHYMQRPDGARTMRLFVKTTGDAAAVTAGIRERLRSIDTEVPAQFTMMESMMGTTVRQQRFVMSVLALFAIIAMTLALVGVYGVVSNAVARRTREIGVRLALGAEPARVRRMVQHSAVGMLGIGLVLGGAAALGFTRLLRSQLFEVEPTDPGVFVATILLLFAGGWIASWIPARRATRIDPLQAMREE
jgi:predicted permease